MYCTESTIYYFKPSKKIFISWHNPFEYLICPQFFFFPSPFWPFFCLFSFALFIDKFFCFFSPVSSKVFCLTFHIFIFFHTIITFILFRSFYNNFSPTFIAESVVQSYLYFHLILKFIKHSSVIYSFILINRSCLHDISLSYKSSIFSFFPLPPPSPPSPSLSPVYLSVSITRIYRCNRPACGPCNQL